MITISNELHKRVADKVIECKDIIRKKHNLEMPAITIDYNLQIRGWSAAADYINMRLLINPSYLFSHTNEMIKQTIPHEVCHLFVYEKYGHNAIGHGFYWMKEMRETFKLFPHVNHIYGVEETWQFNPNEK